VGKNHSKVTTESFEDGELSVVKDLGSSIAYIKQSLSADPDEKHHQAKARVSQETLELHLEPQNNTS